jgi:hypothetical protein
MNTPGEPSPTEQVTYMLGAVLAGAAAGCLALGLIFQAIGILTR